MQLTYQPETNSLRLSRDDRESSPHQHRTLDLEGYVDVGEAGRLVGVEALVGGEHDISLMLSPWLADPDAAEWITLDDDSLYVTLSLEGDPNTDAPVAGEGQVLTAPATLTAELDESERLVALSIPRHGAGYEISYPSGNR